MPNNGFAETQNNSSFRVITLAPNLAEMVYAVGAGSELVGVSENSDTPESAKKIPEVSNFEKINLEKVLFLKPNLILAWAGGNSEVELDQLRSFGIAVEEIQITDILSIADALQKIGKLTGHEKQGLDVAQNFRQKYLALKNKYQNKYQNKYPEKSEFSADSPGGENHRQDQDPPTNRVFFEISESPFYTPGQSSFLINILNLCGAKSVFPALRFEASPVSLEAVIGSNPDVIIAFSPVDPNFWKAWPMINAVRNQHLYQINPDILARPGPRILEGMEKVCDWVSALN